MTSFLKNNKYLLISILINILLFACLMSNCSGQKEGGSTEYIPVHDTIQITKDSLIYHTDTLFCRDTLLRVDSVILGEDGTYVSLPVQYNKYSDVIKTDTTSTEIQINYHGINPVIDSVSIIHNYYNRKETIIKQDKRIHPYVGLSIGPTINSTFTGVKGASCEVRAGLLFKNGWGGEIDYELNAETGGMSHGLKLGVVKQF